MRLVVLLISSKKLAGPGQEKKKKKKKTISRRRRKKRLHWSLWKHLVWKEMPGQLLTCGIPFRVKENNAPLWESVCLARSRGSPEVRRQGDPPPTDYFWEAGNSSNNGPTFSRNKQFSKTEEERFAPPLLLLACVQALPVPLAGQWLHLLQRELVSKTTLVQP